MPKRKTTEEYIEECKQENYDLPIEKYINADSKIKHKCNSCGKIYEQTPYAHVKRGQGCPICGRKKSIKNRKGKTKKKTSKEYIQECKQRGYDLPIEPYVNNRTKIKHKCKQGHVYKQTPNDHLRGKGCKECYTIEITLRNTTRKNQTLITRQGAFLEKCIQLGVDKPLDYTKYKNSHTKIAFKCKQGHTYYQSPDMHTTKNRLTGCPICSQSHGEKFIQNYLNKHGIPYESQKKFNDLKDKAYLSYDFYLPEQKVLIEYQGQQHYEECSYFGGKEKFRNQQLHDKLKREYAKNNGYKLLELHYSLDTQELVNKYLSRRIGI